MSSNQWQCHLCGKVGGFILLGTGLIRCPSCSTIHFVTWGGQIYPAKYTGVYKNEIIVP